MRAPLIIMLLLLAGCDDRPGEWSMIVYPNRADRTKFVVTPRFKTAEYCKEAAIERMNTLQLNGSGDYECGYKCDTSGDPHKMNRCVETRK